ncbi:GNAT family N-acetyltransferase [Microlunatus parietis]|uniref:RimJ/RimL family protein N-acetyltransferase n=1 Tax=Microlunatus parietis TaxID=682979 RepID=A0A7Y9I216_9ACTN|nr:GNAT family protein [Microlunatus parietis]NYE68682.1 RimJ/RimL family protein N-acetyltransferase [Microlunatus parietis]
MTVNESGDASEASSLHRLCWPARTARLTIRPARMEDADAVWAFRSLPAVHRWLSSMPGDRSEWTAHMRRRLPRTLVIKHDQKVIGDLMVRVQNAWGQSEVSEHGRDSEAELGWVLDPAYSGRGYATEAVSELLRICFTELHLRRVVAQCFARNESSWRLMERLGMRREAHTVRDSLHREFGWLDGYSYALLADGWRARPWKAGP